MRALPRGLAAAIVSLALFSAAPAGAVVHVVDFESIPADSPPPGITPSHVTDQYRAATGLYFDPADSEWLPYVTSVGAEAQSGTKVANIFQCATESSNCEGAASATRGRFDTTVSMVQVYVGMFSNGGGPTTVTLRAFDSGGAELTGATPPSTTVNPGEGFKKPLAYTSATPNIASFTVTAPNSATGSIGIDDISFQLPDAPPPPDFSLTADLGTVTLRQGASADVPITINRVNGSTGDITFAASGLPTGVSAAFIPNPATGTSTTLRLTAANDAPPPAPGEGLPEFTVTATPAASAGSEPRSFKKTVRIERSFEVEVAGGAAAVSLPSCLAVDVPVLVRRGGSFTGNVSLAASFPAGNAAGIDVSFDPATVGPGDGRATMRLRVPTAVALTDRELVVTGTSPDAAPASDSITVDRVAQTVEPTTGVGVTPRRMQPGTEITLRGGGFCAGSKVQFGHSDATAGDRANDGPLLLAEATEISADGAEMKAHVPRLGASGKVRVVQPGGPDFASTQDFTVRSYRNTGGFAFDNFPWGNLSFGEMADLFGAKEMFIHVNPCWPWGSCQIPTAIPDPLSFIAWQVIEHFMQESGGHCIGISLTGMKLQAGDVGYNRFSPTATSPYELADYTGPKNGLESYLDSQHAAQTSAEFLDYFFDSAEDLGAQIKVAEDELRAGRQPIVSVRSGSSGHAMTIYDVEAAPDGGTYLYVYDNNHPWVPRDDGPDGTGAGRNELTTLSKHYYHEIDHGRIEISSSRSRWDFRDLGWHGGDQTLTVIPHGVIPNDPTLPLNLDPSTWLNLFILFGSDGSATTGGVEGADKQRFVPALDSAAAPGIGGYIARADGPVTHTVEGQKSGKYHESLMVPGFIASLDGVPTGEGTDDRVRYDVDNRAVSFAGEMDRALHATLAEDVGDETHTAEVKTKTFDGGGDAFGLAGRGGRLVYTHDGAATSFSVVLARTGANGMPVRFESGTLRIRRGEKAVFKPSSWRRLGRVRVTFTSRRGGRRIVVLRDRSRFRGRVKITRLAADGHSLVMGARFGRLPTDATALAAFRVVKGRKTVVHRSVAAMRVGRGRRTFQEAVELPRGRYRLIGYLTLTRPGAAPDSRTVKRVVRFRVSA